MNRFAEKRYCRGCGVFLTDSRSRGYCRGCSRVLSDSRESLRRLVEGRLARRLKVVELVRLALVSRGVSEVSSGAIYAFAVLEGFSLGERSLRWYLSGLAADGLLVCRVSNTGGGRTRFWRLPAGKRKEARV